MLLISTLMKDALIVRIECDAQETNCSCNIVLLGVRPQQ